MGRTYKVPKIYTQIYADYLAALQRAPLAAHTRRAYASRIRGFLNWLADGEADTLGADPLANAHGRDFAARDYRAYLKTVRKLSPATVNAHLAALDHFYGSYLHLGPVKVGRDNPPALAPRALTPREQKRYLRAVERLQLPRDRAIGRLLFYTGLRVGETVGLDVDDVALSARKGQVIVRQGKGGKSRTVPLLNATARDALATWLRDRATWPGANTPPLFLNRRGGRLSDRAVHDLISRIAADADLVDDDGRPVSPHVLRHTFATNLLRESGVDIVTVAQLLGHSRVDTTRRYTLPTEEALERAVSTLPVDE